MLAVFSGSDALPAADEKAIGRNIDRDSNGLTSPGPSSRKMAIGKQPARGVARPPSQNHTLHRVEALETFRSDATDRALTTN
jgi:hypothetical protein